MSEHTIQKSIGLLRTEHDPRVCLLPKEVKRLVSQSQFRIYAESGFGSSVQVSDADYEEAGASIQSRDFIFKNSDFILSLNHVYQGEPIKEDLSFIGIFNPLFYRGRFDLYQKNRASVYSLDLLPRTTLAQSMDVLSSMASLAGYRAVVKAADAYNGIFPMFTTAAGTLTPARVLVLGAGVAGLQAIATARRLGAVVEAFDVRTSAGEEVRSLGATFVEVAGQTESETAGGYAVEQSEDYKNRQKELIHTHISKANIVISTANIPGKKAPLLIEARSVEAMQPGSIIVDLAAEQGGNCSLSRNNEKVIHNEVIIFGNSNLSADIPKAASQLLSNNYFSFLNHLKKTGSADDPLISGTKMIESGTWVHPDFIKTN